MRPPTATALTLNAGSSSLKVALFEVRPGERSIVAAEVERRKIALALKDASSQ